MENKEHQHHHSDHHHHHRHHSHHSYRRRKVIIAVSLALLAALLVIAVAVELLGNKNSDSPTEEAASGFLQIEVINSEGLLVQDAVMEYLQLDMSNSKNADVLVSSFLSGTERLDAQIPVALKLSVKDCRAYFYKIELADNVFFARPEVFYLERESGVYEFKHLYASKTYYYRVTVYTDAGVDSLTGEFTTADTPRILSIDGLFNVRDIGNWQTDSGKRVSQGLLIRGTEMDGAVVSKYSLTSEGMMVMLNMLGIKSEFDLRKETDASKDSLGAQVEHNYYDMALYEEIFTNKGKEKVKNLFVDLANPDNYPIYLHCTYGSDRSGTVCFLLEALLGVSREDCYKDYGLSNLSFEKLQRVEDGLRAYEGDTLKEQVEAYLLSCGVSEAQIESIRNIFLGD